MSILLDKKFFKICTFFKRSFPAKYLHRDVVTALQIPFHLQFEVLVAVKMDMIIETLLVVTVGAFYFSVVSRCPGTDQLMSDAELRTKYVKRMLPICLSEMSELSTVVSLDDLGSVTEINYRTLNKVQR